MTTPNPYGPTPGPTPGPQYSETGPYLDRSVAPGATPWDTPGGGGYPPGAGVDAPVGGGYPPSTAQPFSAPYPYDVPYQQSNQLALVALILSLVAFAAWVTAPAGAICGHIALGQIRRSAGQRGRGQAIAAIAVGWSLTAIMIGYFVVTGWLITSGRW